MQWSSFLEVDHRFLREPISVWSEMLVAESVFLVNFCFQISNKRLSVQMFEYMSSVLSALHSSPAISIAKIHGHALGGATEICSSVDIRIAHSASKIAFFQSKMGIVPSWGGAEYLEKIMGRGKALAAMGRANVMTATEAKSHGWVDFVYETEEEAEVSKRKTDW